MFARILYLIAALLLAATEVAAQPVTTIGPVTPGNLSQYNSPTVIKDSGIPASGLTPCTGLGAFRVGTGGSTQCSDVAGSVAALNGGPLTITPPAATLTQAFNTTQVGNGTTSTSCQNSLAFQFPCLNYFLINGDAIDASSPSNALDGWQFNYITNGGLKGAREVLDVILNFEGASNAASTNRSYVAVSGAANVNSADNGSGGAQQGSFYGANFVVRGTPSATNILGAVGTENDLNWTGAGLKVRLGFSAVSAPSVQGGTYDGAFSVGAGIGTGNIGWLNGLYFSRVNGRDPLDPAGCAICNDGQSATVATFVGMTGYNFANIFLFNNYLLTGSGITTIAENAAPSAPAATLGKWWFDSTDHRFHDKNSSNTIGTTVVADTGAASNFITAISAAGVISKAQPAFTNLSGSLACGQMPALTGDVTSSAASCATTLANIPNDTPAAGDILFTNIAAPASPASGKGRVYVDSTALALQMKNSAGTIFSTMPKVYTTSSPACSPIGGPGSFACTATMDLWEVPGGASGRLVCVNLDANVTNAGTATSFSVAYPYTPKFNAQPGLAFGAITGFLYNWYNASGGQFAKFDGTVPAPVVQHYIAFTCFEAA